MMGARRKTALRLYKNGSAGLNWKHGHSREAEPMVKGMNRRVIVVKSPDPRIFEEAIFILKEDYIKGSSPERLLEEARRAAGEYLQKTGFKGRIPGKTRGGLLAAGAAVMAGIAWAAMRFVGI